MTNPYILLAVGLILVFIEFYVPGAVMGTIGVILIAASLIFFTLENDYPLAVALYIIGIGIGLGFLIKFALWRIKHTRPSMSIYSDASQDGYQASSFDKTLIGKKGVVLSDLKPGGYIIVEDKQHQAISQSGYISKGSEVLVIDGQEESLIVTNLQNSGEKS